MIKIGLTRPGPLPTGSNELEEGNGGASSPVCQRPHLAHLRIYPTAQPLQGLGELTLAKMCSAQSSELKTAVKAVVKFSAYL